MKTPLFSLLLLGTLPLLAQQSTERLPDGGGPYPYEKTPCLTQAERDSIEIRLLASQQRLQKAGLLPQISDRTPVYFDFPLQKDPALDYLNFYGVFNFVDQDLTSGILDYNCGARTYDGHQGTDIIIWPFPWYLVANNYIKVIAAADGTIIDKQDGNVDNHCACSGSWNAVYVQHADGSIAWYGHMKKNSLTGKAIGQTISKGEYVGVVASSGCSTAPHLHFQVYKALPYQQSNLIDPYQGACNALNTQTWWTAQEPYRVSTLNALLTHDAAPVSGCPETNEMPHFSNSFAAGSVAYFSTSYRDQILGQVSSLKIRKPDNTVWKTWSHTSPDTYSISWWYWYWTLPATGPNGTWTFEVTYQGQTFTHNFTVTGALPIELMGFQGKILDKGTVGLTWETAFEKDNAFFSIERSRDGIAFQNIGIVKGNGTTHTTEHYQYNDKSPLSGVNYYRLKQVDVFGTEMYSDVIPVDYTDLMFSISPNPGNGHLQIGGPTERIENIRIYNGQGKMVVLLKGPLSPTIELSGAPAGMYFLEINYDGRIERFKILKQ
jgi:hypothetical protein